jgi:hypothetical protein
MKRESEPEASKLLSHPCTNISVSVGIIGSTGFEESIGIIQENDVVESL